VQSKDGIDGTGITANIIQKDGEARAGHDRVRGGMRSGMRFGRTVRMKKRLNGGFDFAAAGKCKAEACQNHAKSEQGLASATREPGIHE